jgi:hypothetical protein
MGHDEQHPKLGDHEGAHDAREGHRGQQDEVVGQAREGLETHQNQEQEHSAGHYTDRDQEVPAGHSEGHGQS